MPILLFRPPLAQAIPLHTLDFDTRHSTQHISETVIEPGWTGDSLGTFPLYRIVVVRWKETGLKEWTKTFELRFQEGHVCIDQKCCAVSEVWDTSHCCICKLVEGSCKLQAASCKLPRRGLNTVSTAHGGEMKVSTAVVIQLSTCLQLSTFSYLRCSSQARQSVSD